MYISSLLPVTLRRWLLALSCLLGGLPGRAAAPPAAFLRQFGAAEGLSQPFIYCLLQDPRGYLWAGTAEGLVRYDGTRFVTFTTRDGLVENFVTHLWLDPATQVLWVGHYQGSRSRQAAGPDRFRPARASEQPGFAPPAGPPAADTTRLGCYQRRYHFALPAEVTPTCLLEDREGNAWLGTAGQGLWRHSDRFLSLWPTPQRSAPLVLGTLPAAGGTGQVWATADNAAFYQLPASPSGKLTRPNLPERPQPSSTRVLLARPAALGGGFWLGTAAGEVWAVAAPGQPAELVPGLGGRPGLGSAITALAYSPTSGLWVGTQADGVYYLPGGGRAGAAPVHFTTASGLLHNGTTALLASRDGRVWIAAPGTGLAVWQPGRPRFRYYHLASGGLDATALAEDAEGTVWVGTEGQGLFYQRPHATRWQQLTAATGLPDDYLLRLLPLPAPLAGHLLLVHPQGLSLLDTRRATAQPITASTDPLVPGLLAGAALAFGPAPVAWLPTRTGVLRLDLGQLARLPRPTTAPPGLAFTGAEVDGEAHAALALGQLDARPHRVSFDFQGLTLVADGTGELLYRHRLRGLSDDWSRPSPAAEAQFAGLGPGHYRLEVQVRRPGSRAAWSASCTAAFSIATPWWRRGWVLGLAALLALVLLWAVVRGREGVLRRQKFQLENTVRERTAELRQRQRHIEHINSELIVARDAAEASRRAKAQFLANMSHEIRTPMNAVIGLTNLLRETNPTPEQQEYLGAIGSSSQNLLVILNDILDSSKMEAGKLTLEQVPFGLPQLVRSLATMFRYAADSKGLTLRVVVDDAVPAAVLGDPVRLQQVLVNLVSNALKFTRRGGVRVLVRPVAGPPAGPGRVALRFEVHDTGIGIPVDKLTAIFEDFSQANTSTTREFGGTGLGLSIARNLVQLHGSQLAVSSEEGRGSTFFFELTYPLADAELLHAEVAASGPLPPFAPALRVLVAEDNQLNQLVARKTLENWNVQVVIADNGRLAVEQALAATIPFDAVLMDVQMPELDGYAATRLLRQRFPGLAELPIIGLTASVLPEDRDLALAVGMNDILAKPFEPAALYARLAHFTGRPTVAAGPAAEEAAPAPPTLRPNWQQLEELAGGNEQFISQIVNTFLTQAPALEKLLPEAYPHDPTTLAQLAHKLKGQVAYFGVPGLHAQLDELERAARTPGCPYGEALIQTVCQQLGQLYPQLAERS